MFAVYMLQKLWKTFFYASSGHDYSKFTLIDNERNENALYDLLSLKCFSTSMLRIYSEGGEKNRLEKQIDIADVPIAQKYLHVCTRTYYNCNVCNKCQRTLLIFDAIGKLDEFADVFDINYYREHRGDYLAYCYKCHIHPEIDAHLEHAYQVLKDDEQMQQIIRQSPLTPPEEPAPVSSQHEMELERELAEMKKTNTYKLMMRLRRIGDGPFGPPLKKVFHGTLRIRDGLKRLRHKT